MISVQNVDSIAAVEELYNSLERSPNPQQLRVPAHLRGEVVGSRAAPIQVILTWMRRFPDGQLVTHVRGEPDAQAMLAELCDEEHGIVSLLMAPNVVGGSGLAHSKSTYRRSPLLL